MRIAGDHSTFEHDKVQYIESLCGQNLSPEFLKLAQGARAESRKLNKEGISISLAEAYIISELIRQTSSEKFVELGSLTGYSALFILRALKAGGELYCFEKDNHCADFIENLFSNNSAVPELATKSVKVIRGDAREGLEKWTPPATVGGAFIDANKGAYLDYLNWLEANLEGSYLILADNVFLSGAVWGSDSTVFSKKQVQVMSEFNKRLINSSNYDSFFVGTSEGLLVAKKRN